MEEYEQIQKINDRNVRYRALKRFEQKIKMEKREWKELKKQLINLMNEREVFLKQEVMYPREFSSNYSIMEVFKDRIEDYIEKDPLQGKFKAKEFIKTEKGKVKEFIKTKKSVEEFLVTTKSFESEVGKSFEQYSEYLLLKQDLLLNLQKGDLKKVESAISNLKKIIKKNKRANSWIEYALLSYSAKTL